MTLTKRPFLAHRLSTWESELLDEVAAQERAESPQAVAGIPLVEKIPTVSGSIGISTHIRGSGTPVPAPQTEPLVWIDECPHARKRETCSDCMAQCDMHHPVHGDACHLRQDGHTQHFNRDTNAMWSSVRAQLLCDGVSPALQVAATVFDANFTTEEFDSLVARFGNFADNSLGARVQRFLTRKVATGEIAPDAKCVVAVQLPPVEMPKQRMLGVWDTHTPQMQRATAATPSEYQCTSRHPEHDDICHRLNFPHWQHHNISTGRKW